MAAAPLISERRNPFSPSLSALNLAGRVDLISASPLFTGLPKHVCEQIAGRARPRSFARDEMLFMQGQPLRHVALIRTGSVKITQLATNGNEVVLWMYGAGNVVGALSEPTSHYYTCSSRTIEQSTALIWDYSELQNYMLEYPQIRKNAGLVLASRLNELEERFREVATERVAKRVASALLRLMKHIGREAHGGVEVSLSREELAQMTGTTLFTISRLLSKWGEMGFVSPKREAVIVRDSRQLALVDDESFEKGNSLAHGKSFPSRRPVPSLGMMGLALVNSR